LRQNEVRSLDAAREERAYHQLLDKLADHLTSDVVEEEVETALESFFSGLPDDDSELEQDELEMAQDWVAFGHRFPPDGATLCERFAASTGDMTELERGLIAGWAGAAPGFFRVRAVELRELALVRLPDEKRFTVLASGTGLQEGDLVSAWLLPLPLGFRFGYYREVLPPGLDTALSHLLNVELTFLRRQQPDSDWGDLYRQCWPRLVDCITLAVAHGPAVMRIQPPHGPAAGTSGAGPSGSDLRWGMVAQILERELAAADEPPGAVQGALRLWGDAAAALQPRIVKPGTWVAAVIHIYQNAVLGGGVTQAEAASHMGVSPGSVGQRAREIAAALNPEYLDPRYVGLLDPFVRMMWRLACLNACAGGEESPSGTLSPDVGRMLARTQRLLEQNLRPDAGGEDDGPVARAEELIDEAWEASGVKRIRLAKQALALWPDGADAYVILAGGAKDRGDLQEACRLYAEGVRAGERLLGREFFAEAAGHFWGLIETRPYMRARSGLAGCLWQLGDREAAIAHYQELLRLNPGDNQGLRYLLAACLLEMGDDARLGAHLAQHEDDGTAAILFTRTLWQFRRSGPDQEAGALLVEALKENPHVPAYLLGEKRLPPEPPMYIGWGDEPEAVAYAFDFLAGWRQTPGALEWLRSRAGQ
jgi:tetratricopeptide (TPR) repeat protein